MKTLTWKKIFVYSFVLPAVIMLAFVLMIFLDRGIPSPIELQRSLEQTTEQVEKLEQRIEALETDLEAMKAKQRGEVEKQLQEPQKNEPVIKILGDPSQKKKPVIKVIPTK